MRLADLGAAMHCESNFARIPFSYDKVRSLIRYFSQAPDCYLAVWERDGEIRGFMAGATSPAWFGDGRIANDMALYIEPKFRHSTAAVALAKGFTRWAIEKGVKQVRVGTAAGAAGQAANAIYEHLGYKFAGQCFVMDVGVYPGEQLVQREAA
jgi:hypothetical protein